MNHDPLMKLSEKMKIGVLFCSKKVNWKNYLFLKIALIVINSLLTGMAMPHSRLTANIPAKNFILQIFQLLNAKKTFYVYIAHIKKNK